MVRPNAPTQLVAGAVRSRIDLSWVDASSNETGFAIERCAGEDCTSFVQIKTVGANVRAYADALLPVPGTYRYRVRAYNAAGYSPYSNRARPAPPSPGTGSASSRVRHRRRRAAPDPAASRG